MDRDTWGAPVQRGGPRRVSAAAIASRLFKGTGRGGSNRVSETPGGGFYHSGEWSIIFDDLEGRRPPRFGAPAIAVSMRYLCCGMLGATALFQCGCTEIDPREAVSAGIFDFVSGTVTAVLAELLPLPGA